MSPFGRARRTRSSLRWASGFAPRILISSPRSPPPEDSFSPPRQELTTSVSWASRSRQRPERSCTMWSRSVTGAKRGWRSNLTTSIRVVLHSRRPDRWEPARDCDERRKLESLGLVPFRLQGGRRGFSGAGGMGRHRPIHDYRQLRRGGGREPDVRRGGSANSESDPIEHQRAAQPLFQTADVEDGRSELRRGTLECEEPTRVEERPLGVHRGKCLRTELGRRSERVLHPLHGEEPRRDGPVVASRPCVLLEQYLAPRWRGLQCPRVRQQLSKPTDEPS